MQPIVMSWLLALLLGMRHASEPDHVAAISTLLSDRGAAGSDARTGALWGVGHTVSLLAVGSVLMALHARMPHRAADVLELGVAAMLLVLGVRSIATAARAHRAPHARHTDSPRPLLVGLVHGLAGSGALTALALATMPSVAAGLVYMLVFGLGSIAGMAVLTGFAGVPLKRLAAWPRARLTLGVVAGTVSLAAGFAWGWPLVHRLASV